MAVSSAKVCVIVKSYGILKIGIVSTVLYIYETIFRAKVCGIVRICKEYRENLLLYINNEFLKIMKVSISDHTDIPDWRLTLYISYIYTIYSPTNKFCLIRYPLCLREAAKKFF